MARFPSEDVPVMMPVSFGSYLLFGRINVGGTAEVFRALLEEGGDDGEFVAIKKLLPRLASNDELLRRFQDEARLGVLLLHPNIAKTIDFGEVDGEAFMTLEYVSGMDLRSLSERFRRRGEPIPPWLAVWIAACVADALEYAHSLSIEESGRQGVVHGDVSPANVLLSWNGEVKLADFGVSPSSREEASLPADDSQPDSEHPSADSLHGTFAYLSPERVNGAPPGVQSDLWALSVMLWEMLAGRSLFGGDTDYATLENVRRTEVQPPSNFQRDLSRNIERVVMRGLNPYPTARYPSAKALAEKLRELVESFAPPPSQIAVGHYLRGALPGEFEAESNRLSQARNARAADSSANAQGNGASDSEPTRIHRFVWSDPPTEPPRNSRSVRPSSGPASQPSSPRHSAARTGPASDSRRSTQSAPTRSTPTRSTGSSPSSTTQDRKTTPPSVSSSSTSARSPRQHSSSVTPIPGSRSSRSKTSATSRGASPASSTRFAETTTTRLPPVPTMTSPESSRARRGVPIAVGALVTIVAVAVFGLVSGVFALPGSRSGSAMLRMVTDPPDARLVVNGVEVRQSGVGAFEYPVPPGTHEVVALREGHRDLRVDVQVASGERRDVPLLMTPLNPTLTVRTVKDGRVLIDGISLGLGTVTTTAFPPGTYKLRVESECHVDEERTIHMGREDREIEVPLEPIRGRCVAVPPSISKTHGFLAVSSDRFAKVWINGHDIGRETPLRRYPLAPGDYVVRLEAGDVVTEFEVTISAGRTVSRSVSLR